MGTRVLILKEMLLMILIIYLISYTQNSISITYKYTHQENPFVLSLRLTMLYIFSVSSCHITDTWFRRILFFFFSLFFAISWAAPVACGGSQVRSPIGAAAAVATPGLSLSVTYTTAHSNARFLTH